LDTRDRDAGVTVVELLVAMSAFAVVLAVFLDAVHVMTTSMSRVAATARSGTQSRAVADVLGRQLGYASAANLPFYDTGTATWYLEFESDTVRAGDDSRCTQWRYQSSSHLLQYRSWSVVTLAATSWTTVSDALVNDPVTEPPFSLLLSDAGFSVMRVAVNLRLDAGDTEVQSHGQYTLRNSLEAPVPTTSTVCTQLGRP
jgi:hypothetical protein